MSACVNRLLMRGGCSYPLPLVSISAPFVFFSVFVDVMWCDVMRYVVARSFEIVLSFRFFGFSLCFFFSFFLVLGFGAPRGFSLFLSVSSIQRR